MDMMKSTQRVMERNNYHCLAILCSSGQSILQFFSIFEHVKFLLAFGQRKIDFWLLTSYEILLQMDKTNALCTSKTFFFIIITFYKSIFIQFIHMNNWLKIETLSKNGPESTFLRGWYVFFLKFTFLTFDFLWNHIANGQNICLMQK